MISVLLSLLPKGLYDTEPGSTVRTSLEAEAAPLARLEQDIGASLNELFPNTAAATLPEWERVYGLIPYPDDTIEERRARLMALVTLEPSLSPTWLATAASHILGYTPVLRETYVLKVGPSRVGMVGEARVFPATEANRWYLDIDPTRTDRETYDRRPLALLMRAAKPGYTRAHVGFVGPFVVGTSQVDNDQL